MLTVNFNLKTLHIAINNKAEKAENGDKLIHKGVVYHPESVFSKVNTNAERDYAEFFQPENSYRLFCIQTEMGPGEIVNPLGKKFGVDCSYWIGGTIATFTIEAQNFTALCTELAENQSAHEKSEEKEMFTTVEDKTTKALN